MASDELRRQFSRAGTRHRRLQDRDAQAEAPAKLFGTALGPADILRRGTIVIVSDTMVRGLFRHCAFRLLAEGRIRCRRRCYWIGPATSILLVIIENSRSTDPALSGLGCGRIVRVLYALAAGFPSLSRNTPRARAILLGAAVEALQGRSEQKSPAPAVHKLEHELAACTWRQ